MHVYRRLPGTGNKLQHDGHYQVMGLVQRPIRLVYRLTIPGIVIVSVRGRDLGSARVSHDDYRDPRATVSGLFLQHHIAIGHDVVVLGVIEVVYVDGYVLIVGIFGPDSLAELGLDVRTGLTCSVTCPGQTIGSHPPEGVKRVPRGDVYECLVLGVLADQEPSRYPAPKSNEKRY